MKVTQQPKGPRNTPNVRRCEYCKQRRVSVKRLRLFNNEDDAAAGRNGCYRTICEACADNLEGG